MSVFSLIFELLGRIVPALDATTRLVQAVKDTEPPEQPIPDPGADKYLRGALDADASHELQERNKQAGANLAKSLEDEARAEGIEEALGEKPDV